MLMFLPNRSSLLEDWKVIMYNNKFVLGKYKDELAEVLLFEFVGLRSKMYSFYSEESEVKKLGGIPKFIVKNSLTFDNYKGSLFEQSDSVAQMKVFRSNNHHVTTKLQTKISLSSFDDKRYITEDRVSTLAHGH